MPGYNKLKSVQRSHHQYQPMLPTCLIIITTMIIVIITTTTTIIIIIALKDAIRDFHNLLTAPLAVSNTYAEVARAQPCANHVQYIEHLLRATCSVPRDTKGQLSY